MSRQREVTGTFLRERFVFESGDSRTIIADVQTADGSLTIKGDGAEGEFVPGLEYRFYGHFTEYHNRKSGQNERQFRFSTYVVNEPATSEGIVAYLKQCDGIGPATAWAMWERYQSDAVRMLREEPEAVSREISRFKLEKARSASEYLKAFESIEKTKIDLIGLLNGRNFPKKTVDRAIQKWGSAAAAVIRRDPHYLMTFRGCGFLGTDKMYTSIGLNPFRLKRQALCAWYSIARDRDGHTWFNSSLTKQAIRSAISGDEVRVDDAIELALRAKSLSARSENGVLWLAEGRKARAEESLARFLDDARIESETNSHWPDVSMLLGVSDHQRDELAKALEGCVGVLCGSPGTGKSYTAGAVLRLIVETFGIHAVAAAAPTGKAAVRLTESLQQHGVPIQATTIHRLLQIDSTEDGDWEFRFNESNPLPHRFVLIDEMSMVDATLCSQLLAARSAGTCFLFLGDVNQLAPVGHGAPLRDMIAAGIPCGELREIRRNSGRIVQACAEIRDHQRFTASQRMDIESGENLLVLQKHAPQEQITALEDFLNRLRLTGADPVWDCQVLTPMNKKSELSRRELNKRLQGFLNPDGIRIAGNPFRVGDKVINLKNGWFPFYGMPPRGMDTPAWMPRSDQWSSFEYEDHDAAITAAIAIDPDARQREHDEWRRSWDRLPVVNSEGKVFVANGELAEVLQVEQSRTIVRLQSPDRTIIIPHGAKEENNTEEGGDDSASEDSGSMGSWDLGQSISIHKCVAPETLVETSQGLLPICEIAPTGMIAGPVGASEYGEMVAYQSASCRRILTEDGYEITVSDNHRCEVWDGHSWVLREAIELKGGDFVRQRLGVTIEPSCRVILSSVACRRGSPCQFPVDVTPQLAEFFGLMVADGTIFRGGIRLAKAQKETVERFTHLASSLFGVDRPELIYTPGKETGFWTAEICSAHLESWLRKIGGMSPHAKMVPSCILRSCSMAHADFLRGLFEDGSVHVRNDKLDHINWTTSSADLCRTVHLMLLRLGIVAEVSIRRNQHVLYIYSADAKRFASSIGMVSDEKHRRLLLPTYGDGEESSRVRVPVCVDHVRKNRELFVKAIGKANYKNILQRGYISRRIADRCSHLLGTNSDCRSWHYSRIESVSHCTGPVMCVAVPKQGRFLQAGFPWSNSQGSEWPWVIVMLDPAARRMMSRNLIYTAISRAKKGCLLIGPKSLADEACRKNGLQRKTLLVERLRDLANPPIQLNDDELDQIFGEL